MGNVAGYRQAFADAQDYQQQWDKYHREMEQYQKESGKHGSTRPAPPKRDLKLETLAEVLKGNIRVHVHCYRADEMATMLDISDEFGFKIVAFHHAVEAYKIADRLAERGVCAAMWADWWGFKMEAFDGVQENLPMVDYPEHSCAIVHSDSDSLVQRLNQEAAKAMAHGERVGLHVSPERAIRWLTINPAKSLGLQDRIGSLEPGKWADFILVDRDLFRIPPADIWKIKVEQTWVGGRRVY
jgi:imidazolonepropionase-like amidohydrolase